MELADSFDGRNSNCITNLTSDQVYSAIVISGLSFFSFVISVVGITLGLHEYWIKNRLSEFRTERLLLYLTVIALVFSFLGSFQWLALLATKFHVAETACTILGFLWFTVSVYHVSFILCLSVHFLILICAPKQFQVTREEKAKRFKRMEMTYLIVATTLALVLSPWPFLDHLYGFNLRICWIKTMRYDCSIIDIGVIETTLLYSIMLLIYVFSFVIVVIVQIIILLRRRSLANSHVWILTTHLILGLIIIFFVTTINLLPQDLVPSEMHSSNILAIPTLPLTMSLVTTLAVVFKKSGCGKKRTTCASNNTNRHSYGSVFEIDGTTRTTVWKSPPTNIANSSTQGGTNTMINIIIYCKIHDCQWHYKHCA